MALILFIISFSLHAHIIQDDVSITAKDRFPLKAVCQKMLNHESPLIDILSGTEIDCMGKKIEVRAFCEREMVQDPYYLRAYVDRDKKEVVCVSGKKVLFKYQCVKLADHRLCQDDPKRSCAFIQDKLAKSLDLVHSSVVKNEKGIEQLNCFFEAIPLNEKKIGTL